MMKAGNNVIKITALTALKGKYLKTVFSCLILIFSVFIGLFIISLLEIFLPSLITNILGIAYLIFAVSPLFLGTLRYIWRLLFAVNDNPITVFFYFSEKKLYLKALKLFALTLIRIIPLAALVSLPAILARVISMGNVFEHFNLAIPIWAANLSYAYIFLSTIAFVIVILHSLKFYIAPILFVADGNMDVEEAIHMSKVISKKTSLEFLYLIFGFLGWILLSVLVIPLVFVLPYFLASYAVHSRFAIAEYNIHIAKNREEEMPTFITGV